MTEDEASRIAIAALTHVASDEDLMPRFLAMTGIEATGIRQAAADPNFLAGILDFLLGHEPDAIAFAQAHEIDPAALMQARATLGGDPAPWHSI